MRLFCYIKLQKKAFSRFVYVNSYSKGQDEQASYLSALIMKKTWKINVWIKGLLVSNYLLKVIEYTVRL